MELRVARANRRSLIRCSRCLSPGYLEPMVLEEGEIPADLLSRLPESQGSPKTSEGASAQLPDFLGGPSGIRTRLEAA